MSFLANENKGLLWNMLNTHNVFDGISQTQLVAVKEHFERTLQKINENPTNLPLVNLNKLVLSSMMQDMTYFRPTPPVPTPPQRALPPVLMTAQALSEQKQAVFLNNLKSKETEFLTQLTNPLPPKIDFADVNLEEDKPIGSDMDRLLAEITAKREKDLQLSVPPPPPTTNSNSNTLPLPLSLPPAIVRPVTGPSILKIGPEIKTKKVVNFVEEILQQPNSASGTDVLKEEKKADSKTLIRLLTELLTCQQEMLLMIKNSIKP